MFTTFLALLYFPVVLVRWWWEKSRKRKQWFLHPPLYLTKTQQKHEPKIKRTDEFSWHIKQVIKSHLKQQHNQFTPFYRIVVKSFILSQTLWNNHYVIIERINWWSFKVSCLAFATTITVVKISREKNKQIY